MKQKPSNLYNFWCNKADSSYWAKTNNIISCLSLKIEWLCFFLHYLYIQLWRGGWESKQWIKMRKSIHIISSTNMFPSFQTPTTSFKMLSFISLSVKRQRIPMILFFTLQMVVQDPLGVPVEIAFIIAFRLNSDFMVPWYLCLFSSLLWKSNGVCVIKVYTDYILLYESRRSRVFSLALPGSG